MTTKTATKKSGAKTTATNNSKKATTKKNGKVVGITNIEIIELPDDPQQTTDKQQSNEVVEVGNVEDSARQGKKTVNKKTNKATSAAPAAKKVQPAKKVAVREKKVRLASSCYHYYRHFLKEFLRPIVPSSRFQKSAESYDGHIIVAESEKAKGLKALEKWKKENPDVKELFWDVKK